MPRNARIDAPGALHHINRRHRRSGQLFQNRYKIFVQKGIQEGKRPELTGSGLIRSSGWSVIKSLRRANIHFKSDERVLGDSDFVEKVLRAADESLERKYELKSKGYDIDKLSDRVAEIFSIDPEEIFQPGKQPLKVKAATKILKFM